MKKRHIDGHPYTRTGDIVIAVNPFQWFHNLYTEDMRTKYSNKLVWQDSEKDPREGLDPHVYEVSALSYKGLAFGGNDQSILVSGESGAGYVQCAFGSPNMSEPVSHASTVRRRPSRFA